MRERRVAGRIGDLTNIADQDNERERRRIWPNRAMAQSDVATTEETIRTREHLDRDADWKEVREPRTETPCKTTRVERETALAERRIATSPSDALAYASWLLNSERGWSGTRLEEPISQSRTTGALASAFEFMEFMGEVQPVAAVSSRAVLTMGVAPTRLAARLRPGVGKSAAAEHIDDIEDILALVRSDGPGEPLPSDIVAAERPQLGEAAVLVRIHVSAIANEAAHLLGASAFTIGRDIYFAAGEYAPGTAEGDRLLRHELTHVRQYERGELAAGSRTDLLEQSSTSEAEARAAETVEWAAVRKPQRSQATRTKRLHHDQADLQERSRFESSLSRLSEEAQFPIELADKTKPQVAPEDSTPARLRSNDAERHVSSAIPMVLRSATGSAIDDDPEEHVQAEILPSLHQSQGKALPPDVLLMMQRLLNHSFADVTIHIDNYADEHAATLDARAFTIGNQIFFREDSYQPETSSGRELLAHELTHVIQWRQGRVPEANGSIQVSSPGDSLEQEAAAAGRRVVENISRDTDYASDEGPVDRTGLDRTGHVVPVTASAVRGTKEQMILRDVPIGVGAIPSGGTQISRVGIVAWDGQPELRLRSSANTSADNVITSLAFNTTLQVIKEFPGGWYFVSTQNGQLGYLAKAYVKTNLPEPNAKLHRVENGPPGYAISIAARYYRQYAHNWGQDLRFYVNVLAWVNNHPLPNNESGWRELRFDADEFIWIPSHSFARTLVGVVNSGSISHNIADSIGIAEFLDRTEELYRDIDTAIQLSARYLPEAIGRHVEAALLGVLESLALMMAIAAGVLAITTALGAGIGALAGGVGAAPGAALGFEVGMILLQWLGLGMLVVWVGQSLQRVGAAFGSFLSMVWNARGNQGQLDRAARQFAEAIGTLCGVVLEGLVMWAVSIGVTRAISALRGTRFGSKFNNSETGQWLNERVRRVQSGESPLRTPRAVFERLIRSVELVDARNSPLGEFDGIDMAGRRFVENKSATGIERPTPRTGLPQQTATQWAVRQIATKTTSRIRALANAVATRGPSGSEVPSLAEIQSFRHIHFMIDGTSPALRAAVFAELASLRTAHPGWTFTAEFGITFTIPPVPSTGTPEE